MLGTGNRTEGPTVDPVFLPPPFSVLVPSDSASWLGFQRITDEGVVQICRGCPRLQALCLSGCSNLTDASLTALALNCPRLQ